MNSTERIGEILVENADKWYDVKAMADEANVSESTVRRAYKVLKKKQNVETRELSGRIQLSYLPPVIIDAEKQRRRWFRRKKK